MKKARKFTLDPNTLIDVKMVKTMSCSEYLELKNSGKFKGWNIQGYQKGMIKI